MKIRNAKLMDLDSILGIYMDNYDEVRKDPSLGVPIRLKKPAGKSQRDWIKNTYSKISKGNAMYDVLEDNGKILGFCFVEKADVPDSELSHVGVLGIEVVGRQRGKGLGTRLLSHILNRCRGKFDIIEISVFNNNPKAKLLYKKFGFRTWGVAPGFLKRNNRYIDVGHMYLRLKK